MKMHDAASAIAMLPWVIARNHMLVNTLRVSSAERPVACMTGNSFRWRYPPNRSKRQNITKLIMHKSKCSQCVPQLSWLRLGSSKQLITTSYDDNRNLLKSTAPAQLQPISRLPKFQRQQEQHGRSDSYTPMCFINKKS